jgi:omega-6 fatty acid desaturase / acyl-lipid omega-6 desaturase (Delta-12 desaturase)
MGRGGDGTVPTRRSARHVPASALQVPAKSRAPSSPPPFTLGQLRAAVPPHCFRKSLAKSSAYLVADCLAATAIFAAAQALDRTFAHLPVLQLLLWAVYAVVQGTVCTGIWVIAHECGHGAFSDYAAVNDSVGLVLHSALLVPYFSWKYSHSRHHAGTGSMTRDEVFAPKTEAQGAAKTMHWQTTTPGRLLMLLITLTLGWPLYLVMNAGSRKYKPKHANHFWPFSPVFRGSKERLMVAVSDVALLAVVAGLRQLARTYGGWWLITRYVAPYLVVRVERDN